MGNSSRDIYLPPRPEDPKFVSFLFTDYGGYGVAHKDAKMWGFYC